MFPREHKFKSLVLKERRKKLPNYKVIIESSDNINDFIENIQNVSKRDLRKIERRTVFLSKTDDWFYYRKNLITSTLVKDVVKAVEKEENRDNINGSITKKDYYQLYYPAVVYGRQFESVGLDAFVKEFKKSHQEVSIFKHGLKIEESTRILGGSIDLRVKCSCHGEYIVELKCSYKLKDSDNPNWCSLDYITNDLKLNVNHPYMYQIQSYLGIYQIPKGLFVVWTPKKSLIIDVKLDEILWERIKKSAKTYYYKYYLPEEYPELYE